MSTGQPSKTAKIQKDILDSTAHTQNTQDLGIENTNVNTAAGVSLSSEQKTLIGSVLDLFAGRPSLKKLQLWTDDAKFNDPLTKSEGRKQYEAQWYGLQAAFSEIERLGHQVTSAGNPIEMNLKTRYKIKGIGKEQVIESVVNIYTNGENKITEVQDRWNNEIHEGPFAKVRRSSLLNLANPLWWILVWIDFGLGLNIWVLGKVWEIWWWEAFRNLNSVVVPAFVSVPKNEEEDRKKGN